MTEKKYYWLKLKDDFFDGVKIKKLRQLAGGDTYTIIYLKMLLKAIKSDGTLVYQGVEDNISDEIALDINEAPENVQVTLQYLFSKGLAERIDNDCFFPEAIEQVGSENSSAQRVREFRERQRALHCNADVTQVKRLCNTEIEIDKDIDKDLEIKIDEEIDKDTRKEKRRSGVFTPPTLAEVQNYCREKGFTNVDAERFIDFYESKGWMVGRNKMKDWKASVRNWERDNRPKNGSTGNAYMDAIKNRVNVVDDWVEQAKREGLC